jgi:NitT/TauT family transport system permease protein
MSVAIAEGNVPSMIYAIIAMTLMIVAVDQLFWRPIVAWAQKYKFEETATSVATSSFVLDLLQKSHALKFARDRLWHPMYSALSLRLIGGGTVPIAVVTVGQSPGPVSKAVKAVLRWLVGIVAGALLIAGALKLLSLLASVDRTEWLTIAARLGLTFIRVGVAVALGTLIMIPLGVAIGLHPKLSRVLQPVVQVAASFPAPMLFPLVILALSGVGVGIEVGAVFLMMLGTQWYILFNVVAGAMAIPNDLREAAEVSRLTRVQTWKQLILPGIFPSLVTGWVTATGGAWNASIVAEYVHFGHRQLIATGLGSTITVATDKGNFGVLAAAVLAMAGTVVLVNRVFWKKLYHKAEGKFSLNK